jgi:HK97 family phage portal protein
MKILNRIWKPKVETRTEDVSWTQLSTTGFPGYGAMSANLAENLSAVAACISVISSSVASLPAWVYRSSGQGRKIVDGHPLTGLIEQGPNARQSWPDFVEWLLGQVLLRGNALAWVKTDQAGQVESIEPLPWQNTSVEQLASGRLRFTCIMPGIGGHTGRTVTVLDSECLHIRDRSDDGILGRSRLSRAASVFRAGLSLQQHSEQVWESGATPGGVLKYAEKLSTEAVNNLRQRFEQVHRGSANAKKILILDNGLEFQGLSFSPEDAELLESRKFGVVEIARIFGCPPPLIQDYSHNTFTNSSEASKWFSQFCLGPWCKKLEAAFKQSVFGASEPDVSIEFDLSGLQRGDFLTRWQANKIAVEAGILTANEIREQEGFPPHQGGQTV